MRRTAVAKPGLIVAAFAPVETDVRDRPGDAPPYFVSAWQACAQLRMRDRIEPLGLPTQLNWPAHGSDFSELKLLAARERRDPTASVYQAIVFAVHDSIVLVVMLAPNRVKDGLSTWNELYDEWIAAGGPTELPGDLLGEAWLFTALGASDPEQIARLGAEAREFVPKNIAPPAADGYFRSDDDLFVWEQRRSAKRSALAVLAPDHCEQALDAWTWWDNRLGRRGLDQGLAHLLLNVFKLRQQHAVYEQRAAHLRDLEPKVDNALGELLGFLGSPEDRLRDRSSTGELVRLQDALARQQARSGGLLFQTSRLLELRQTVTAAGVNIGLLMPAAHERSPDPLFLRDIALAERLPEQIDLELAYAKAVQERAQEAYRLTSLRLQQGLEHQAREQARLTLLQTSLLGALLAAVGATATLNAHVGLALRLRVPAIAVLAGSVLALPHLIVNWTERYRPLDYAVTAAYGAAWGWFLTRVAQLASPLQIVGSIAGGVLFVLLARTLETRVAGRTREWLREQDGPHPLAKARAKFAAAQSPPSAEPSTPALAKDGEEIPARGGTGIREADSAASAQDSPGRA